MKIKLFNSKITGLYILILGTSILIKVIVPQLKMIYFIFSFLTIFSLHLSVQILISKKRKKLIVGAFSLFLISLFTLLYLLFINKYYKIEFIWPILGIFPASGLILYYFISNNKSPASIIPGFFIIFLSLILLLITNKLIKLNFISVLTLLIAAMFIFTGLFLIFKKKIEEIKKQIDNKKNLFNNK